MVKLIKALFPADSKDWHGMNGEWLWVESNEKGDCYVVNIPLYTYGVSYMDRISLNKERRILFFNKVIEFSGNHTYRILLKRGHSKFDFEKRWPSFAAYGCSYESSKNPEDVFGINVPKNSDVALIYKLLENGESDGVWYFDEGNYVLG